MAGGVRLLECRVMIMAWVKMVVNSPRARGAGFRLACDDSSEWLYGCGF